MFFFALIVLVAVSNATFYQGDVVLRIVPSSDTEIHLLKKWLHEGVVELDIWRDVSHPGANVDVHIKASDVTNVKEMLTKNNIKFSLMIDDLQQIVDEEQISNQKNAYAFGFDYNKYNPYSSIKFELGNLGRKYRSRAKLFNVGKTALGQRMVGIQITDGSPVGSKPIIWIDGGIHAREWVSVSTVMYLIRELLESKSEEVKKALQKYEFHILPVFNVDGYKYSFTGVRGARMWRKTRSSYGGCKGADPNRNWSFKWGVAGTSRTACNENYRGPHAFSEVEVSNVKKYLQDIKSKLKAYWNLHAYSQFVLLPWAYTKTEQPQDYKEMSRVAQIFVDKVASKFGIKYKAGPTSELIYEVGGSGIDWVYGELGVKYSYALELRDTGEHGFMLPADQIKPTGEETTVALLAATNAMK